MNFFCGFYVEMVVGCVCLLVSLQDCHLLETERTVHTPTHPYTPTNEGNVHILSGTNALTNSS